MNGLDQTPERHWQVKQDFLLRLADTLRPLTDPIAVQDAAARMLGIELAVERCYYAEFDWPRNVLTIGTEYVRSPSFSVIGEHPTSAFQDLLRHSHKGEPLVCDEISIHPLYRAEAAAYRERGTDGFILVPLVKEGTMVACMCVTMSVPRKWTPEDVELVREVQDRTWDAVERARAEVARREGEEDYRALFTSMNQGFCIIEKLLTAPGEPSDYRYIVANPAFEQQIGASDVVGKTILEAFPGAEITFRDRYDDILKTGRPQLFQEYTATVDRWVEVEAFAARKPRQVAVLFSNISLKKRAEAALAASEERQAFLLKLSDALWPLSDAVEIEGEATRLLREHFDAGWCYYAEFVESGTAVQILRDNVRGALPSLAGYHEMQDLPELLDHLAAGKVMNAPNLRAFSFFNKRVVDQYTAIGMQSFVGTPLMKGGRLFAFIMLADTQTRQWSDGVISILQDVAERTWAAVERANAKAALLESEAALVHVQRIAKVGKLEIDVTGGLLGLRTPDYSELHGVDPNAPTETHAKWRERVHPDDRDRAERMLLDALNGTTSRYENEYRIIRPSDGAMRWIRAVGDIERVAGTAVRLVGAHIDVTDQKRMQDMLRKSEERQAFLLKLSDTLRPLSDPDSIKKAAAQLLGEHLAVNRAYYGEVIGDDWVVLGSFAQGIDPLTPGHYPANSYGDWIMQTYRAGEVLKFADSRTDPRLSAAQREAHGRLGIIAAVGVGLVKQNNLVAILAVNSIIARAWTAEEVALIQEVAERTWAAVQQARAEAARREAEEEYRALFTAMDQGFCIIEKLATAPSDPSDYRYIVANPSFQRQTGLTDVVGKTVRELFPSAKTTFIERYDDILKTGNSQGFQEYTDTVERWIEVEAFAASKPGQIAVLFRDISDKKRAELRLRSLMEGIPPLVWTAVDDGQWTWSSPQWSNFTGLSPAESVGRGWIKAVHPDDRALAEAAWRTAVSEGQFEAEFRLRDASIEATDANWRWFQNRATAVRDELGRIVEWLGTSTDVQELKDLTSRQGVLVAELQHRTRNLLGVVQSLSDQTLKSSVSLSDFASQYGNRIAALARANTFLSSLDEGRRVAFDELLRAEINALGDVQNKVVLSGPVGISLRSSAVQILALALHELATNALKNGALGQRDGQLSVSWKRVDVDKEPWLHIEWQEWGIIMSPASLEPKAGGAGRLLIEQALPYQLGARTSFALTQDGVRCSISLPVSKNNGEGKDDG